LTFKLGGQVFQHTAKIYAASSILVTNLSGASRSKRRLVEFKDIPKVLVDAVTAGEDQSFFSHHGLDPLRIAGAFVSNLHETHRLQGGSTITQQLARSGRWRRAEILQVVGTAPYHVLPASQFRIDFSAPRHPS
jgi:membrane peptidoglycan carboxypeptidase